MSKKWKNWLLLLLCAVILGGSLQWNDTAVYATEKTETIQNETEKQGTSSQIPEERDLPRLVDDADLLSDSEEEELLGDLDEISERQKFDVAVVTVNSLEGKTAEEYADDFYDYHGYGFGADHDGILLLVSMEARDWHITTTGYGITAFTDAGIEYISDQFLPYLSDGEYFQAFEMYAGLCDEFVTEAVNGEAYDSDSLPKGDFPVLEYLGIALIAGVILSALIVVGMRSSLKSVRRQNAAANYVRQGSMAVTGQYDRFLYMHTSKKPRPKPSESSSGSSTHVSSSGTTHGGGGGKF